MGQLEWEATEAENEDRAAAEALVAALRALLESLPRCSHLGCPRAATMIQDSNSRRVCSHHLWDGGRGLVGIRGIEQAEAALAAWEARRR